MPDYYYDIDYAGDSVDNKIENELHTLTSVNGNNYYFIIPEFAPYFYDSLRIFYIDSNGPVPLAKDIDYSPALQFQGASYVAGTPVYGGVNIHNTGVSGTIYVTYQTLGGDYTFKGRQITSRLANIIYNPGGITWEQVLNRPIVYSTADHELPFETLVGMSGIRDQLDAVEGNISNKIHENISTHLTDRQNPHHLTKELIRLGKVANYAPATEEQAISGLTDQATITPKVLAKVLEFYELSDVTSIVAFLKSHLEDFTNPHEISKTQVSLALLENLPVANLKEVLGKEKVKKYLTLDSLILYLQLYGCRPVYEEEPPATPDGSLLSIYCDNFDRYGVYADGVGGSYTEMIEKDSPDCGFENPQLVTQYLEAGSLLGRYCVGVDRYGRFADGQGGTYSRIITTNSVQCGYKGMYPGDGGIIKEGTLIATRCEERDLIKVFADGQGGEYTETVKESPDCIAGLPKYPPSGTSLGTFCEGANLKERFADGMGGTYAVIKIRNSKECGYVAPPPLEPPAPPTAPPPPSIIPPAPPGAGPQPPSPTTPGGTTPGGSTTSKTVEIFKGNNCEVGLGVASYDMLTRTMLVTGPNVFDGIMYDTHEAYTGIWNRLDNILPAVASQGQILFTNVSDFDFDKVYRIIGNDHCWIVTKNLGFQRGPDTQVLTKTAVYNFNDSTLMLMSEDLITDMVYTLFTQTLEGVWEKAEDISLSTASNGQLVFYNVPELLYNRPLRIVGTSSV